MIHFDVIIATKLNHNDMSKHKLKTDKPFKITYDWKKMWASNVYLDDEFVATVYGKTKQECKNHINLITMCFEIRL